MSGDTPTAHFGMKLHNLECPDCSCDVFARETAHWTTDLAEHCAGCGSDLRVALDEDPDDPDALTARVFVHEHGGDVVARLRTELEQAKYEADYTPPLGAVSDHVRARIAEAGRAALAGKGGCVGEACIPAHQASEVLDAHDDAQADVKRLTEDETERVQDARHAMRLARIDRGVAEKEVERLTANLKTAVSYAGECKADLVRAEALHLVEVKRINASWLSSQQGLESEVERLTGLVDRYNATCTRRGEAVEQLTRERDAAIRERDSSRRQVVGYYIEGTHGNRPPTTEELRVGSEAFGYEYLYPEDSTTDETERPDPDDMHGAGDDFGGSDF